MTAEILRMAGLRVVTASETDKEPKIIVNDIDLVVHRGEVLGLIGK